MACTPTLNWREVSLDRLTVLLPCKPDRAQRTVKLGMGEVAMEMAGCEAGDALYAVSHVHVSNTDVPQAVVQQWQTVALGNLQSSTPQSLPWATPKGANAAVRLAASGQRANGEAMTAQLAWLTSGSDIYHVAVYSKKLAPEQSDTLFSDLKIQ
jgi:hypothetical protein